MDQFKAHTHHGDWKGSAAADEAHADSVHRLLRQMELIKQNEFLVSVSFSSGEGSFIVGAFVLEGLSEVGQVEKYLSTHTGPIPVRELRFEMKPAEFLNLFKDLNVLLTWQDLKLEGRACTIKEQEPIHAQN